LKSVSLHEKIFILRVPNPWKTLIFEITEKLSTKCLFKKYHQVSWIFVADALFIPKTKEPVYTRMHSDRLL